MAAVSVKIRAVITNKRAWTRLAAACEKFNALLEKHGLAGCPEAIEMTRAWKAAMKSMKAEFPKKDE